MTESTDEKYRDGARKKLGDFSPEFVERTDSLLYGNVWGDPLLSKRDRSLITVASLVSLYRTDQISHHLERALDNGVTEQELIAAVEHLAFYAGWPAGMTAMTHLKEIVENRSRADETVVGWS